jgi:hypothetical protein
MLATFVKAFHNFKYGLQLYKSFFHKTKVSLSFPQNDAVPQLYKRGFVSYNRSKFIFSTKCCCLIKISFQHAANPVHWFPWGEEAFEVNQHFVKLFSFESRMLI